MVSKTNNHLMQVKSIAECNELRKYSDSLQTEKKKVMEELIVYQLLQRPSVCQHFQTSSPLKPLGQLIKLKFHMETSLDAGMKVCSNRPSHMT